MMRKCLYPPQSWKYAPENTYLEIQAELPEHCTDPNYTLLLEDEQAHHVNKL